MIEPDLQFHPSERLLRRMGALAAVGLATFIVGLAVAPERTWMLLLLVSVYLLSLGLAGVMFVAFQYVTGASWSVALRRVPEAMTVVLPAGGLGLLAVLFFRSSLYSWTNPAAGHTMPAFKHWWLNLGFFRGRAIVFLALWSLIGSFIVKASRQQDRDGSPLHTRRNLTYSAALLVVLGLTYWLAAFDWIMSLQPEWASTIFGVYNFAGLFTSGLATLVILLVWLRGRRPMNQVITVHHLHDCGKLMFAFSTFWMYLWFSQYMLIWYANIPEEASYYAQRQHGFWAPLLLLNVVLNWVLPFLALLPKRNKQSPGVLVKVAVVLLAGRWLDLYLMIAPPFMGASPRIGLLEIGLMAGAVGVFALAFFAALRRAPLVPVHDPHLAESLHYHA
jgi:hypothetical protein